MSQRRWRGTILFTVIVVVMGATIGLKLCGLGQKPTSVAAVPTATSSGATTTGEGSEDENSTTPPATATPTPSSPSPSASPSASTKVVTGNAVETGYGPIQLQVTFSGTTIQAIQALQTPNEGGRSVSINQQAVPMLTQEALASQSAHIDTVSGATYTSEGYMQSLQSAIDHR